MKKIYSLFFVLIVCSKVVSAVNVNIGELTYNLNTSQKTASVIGASSLYIKDITIPNIIEHDGCAYAVTSIKTFSTQYDDVSYLSIPNSITDIETGALAKSFPYLTSIYVSPENLTYCSIDGALLSKDGKVLISYPCEKNRIYSIPNGVTDIKRHAFWGCHRLDSIQIPNSVSNIEARAFCNNPRLKAIMVAKDNSAYCSLDGVLYTKDRTKLIAYPCYKKGKYIIPDGVISIEEGAFSNCNGLTSISIPNSTKNIGESAFSSCLYLDSAHIANGVTHIGKYAFYNCEALDFITIPSSVLRIEACAFNECRSLTHITIPDSVSIIKGYTFDGCKNLQTVRIGKRVSNISLSAFNTCKKLTSINIAEDNPTYCSIDGVVFSKDKTIIELYPRGKKGNYTIPIGVTTIRNSAFAFCLHLDSITIPNSVNRIEGHAFEGCYNLTSILIANKNAFIGRQAFPDSPNLIITYE